MIRIRDFLPQPPNFEVAWAEIEQAFDWPAKLGGTPQDNRFHAEGDCLTHTRMVVQSLIESETFRQAPEDTRYILFTAALLHDIAKPSRTKTEEDGRVTAYGHSERGAIDARIMLWEQGEDFHAREAVARIICVHQQPFFGLKIANGEFRLRKLSHELRVDWLCQVAHADASGRRTNPSSLRTDTMQEVEIYRLMAEEQGCLDRPYYFPDTHTAMVYFEKRGRRDPSYVAHDDTRGKVIIMCGLPGSGKNTWIEKHAAELPTLSYDDTKRAMGIKHGDNPGVAVHAVISEAKFHLARGHEFVWNATHLSREMRVKAISLARQYKTRVELVYIEVSRDELFSRNRARGDHSLTESDLQRMLFRWQVPAPWEGH